MNKRQNHGITLIALIITVIVLLILAGIAIAALAGDNGIITQAKEAKNKHNAGQVDEEEKLGGIYDVIAGVEDELNSGGIAKPDIPEIKENETTSGGDFASSAGVIEIAWLDLENKVIENPLTPKLKTGMQPIKWNGVTEANAGTTSSPSSDWYSYKAQTGATDGKTSNWANIKLTDGSYFVWIPRYAYKIIYFDTEAHANDYRTNGLTDTNKQWIQGYSTVHGIMDKDKKVIENTNPNIDYKVKTAGYTDYIPHPAFLGTGYEDLGGGFGINNKGIDGFWMAKFEMSGETNGNPSTPGNVATSSTVKMVSKPNVSSWRNIYVSNMYENSKNYDTNIGHADYDSHLIKNSEWGAVAYLTHSKYGRNGTEVRINNNSGFYTGWGATTNDASSVSYNASQADNLWTGQYGQLASSTGNITGIYDMSGGAWEYTSVFNKAYSGIYFTSYKSTVGTHFAENGKNSTKYETAYNHNASGYTINKFIDYYTNGKNASRTGDATVEVFVQNAKAWNEDYTDIVDLDYPFLERGGYYDDGERAGVFYSCSNDR